MRIASVLPAQLIAGRAVLRYGDVHTKSRTTPTPVLTAYIDDRGTNTTEFVRYFDQTTIKMYPPSPVSAVAHQTSKMFMCTAG